MKKKFQVGDKVTITDKQGEELTGTIIDFDFYNGQIVFKIVLINGQEVDLSRAQLQELLKRRK